MVSAPGGCHQLCRLQRGLGGGLGWQSREKDETTYPGRWGWWLNNVVGVGSVDNDDKLSAFSSFGADVFSWAPGNDVLATIQTVARPMYGVLPLLLQL